MTNLTRNQWSKIILFLNEKIPPSACNICIFISISELEYNCVNITDSKVCLITNDTSVSLLNYIVNINTAIGCDDFFKRTRE